LHILIYFIYLGAYGIDDDPSIFRLIIASIVDRESFYKQCRQLDSATRDYLATRLDYYQINITISRQYRAHSYFTVVDNNSDLLVTKITNDGCNNGLVWDASIHKFTLTIYKSLNSNIMIGFAPSKLYDVSKGNHISCGWYLYLQNGTLYSQNGDKYKAYTSGCNVGDTITCTCNVASSEIAYEKNGVALGVAFTNVKGEDIAPAVEMFNGSDVVTLSIVS
jgi:SPRY domain